MRDRTPSGRSGSRGSLKTLAIQSNWTCGNGRRGLTSLLQSKSPLATPAEAVPTCTFTDSSKRSCVPAYPSTHGPSLSITRRLYSPPHTRRTSSRPGAARGHPRPPDAHPRRRTPRDSQNQIQSRSGSCRSRRTAACATLERSGPGPVPASVRRRPSRHIKRGHHPRYYLRQVRRTSEGMTGGRGHPRPPPPSAR
jgi:hypothetical protein